MKKQKETEEKTNTCLFCGKSITQDRKYCNEECLRKSIESRLPNKIKPRRKNQSQEITDILFYLDRADDKGDFRAENLTKLLRYCQIWQNGKFNELIKRLSLRLGMDNRYVRKNYLDGLAIEGIISVVSDSWRWVGLPNLNDSSLEENIKKGVNE